LGEIESGDRHGVSRSWSGYGDGLSLVYRLNLRLLLLLLGLLSCLLVLVGLLLLLWRRLKIFWLRVLSGSLAPLDSRLDGICEHGIPVVFVLVVVVIVTPVGVGVQVIVISGDL
jgi:hypothetical protein